MIVIEKGFVWPLYILWGIKQVQPTMIVMRFLLLISFIFLMACSTNSNQSTNSQPNTENSDAPQTDLPDSNNDTNSITSDNSNIEPTANAGNDLNVKERQLVTLSGEGVDTDGSIVSYSWLQTAGATVTLSESAIETPQFTAPSVNETLSFELTVTDNGGLSHSDAINVNIILNIAPIVDAGSNQSVIEQNSVTLTGSGSDDDGSITSYLWQQISGTAVTLIDANTTTANFTAPSVAETLVFTLTVIDDFGATQTATQNVEITLKAQPLVSANSDQSVVGLMPVTIDGLATGENSDAYLLQWTQIKGESVMLENANTASISFVAPAQDQTLTFKLTVTGENIQTTEDEVSVIVNNQLVLAPAIATVPYVSTDKATYDTVDDCNSFEPNWFEPSWNWSAAPVYEFNAGPLVVTIGDDYSNLSVEDAAALVALQTDPTMQQNLSNNLLEMRRIFSDDFGLNISNTVSNSNGKCYRTSMFVSGTLLWPSDPNPSSGAGTSAYPDQIPWMMVPHAEILAMTVANAPTTRTIPHEYLHAQQFDITRGYQDGWWWYVESYAMYVANSIQGVAEFLPGYHFMRHWAIDSAMTRYNTWPFWMFLANKFGQTFAADIIQRNSSPDENLLEFIRRIAPFNCDVSDNTCREAGMANLYAEFANSTVNYSQYSTNLGMDVRTYALDTPWGDSRISDRLLKTGESSYRIPDWLAPQRFSHNIIELIPDPDSEWLSISLDGWDVPERGAEWRATIVATLDDKVVPPVEIYGEMFAQGTQHINLPQWEATLGNSIKRLELVVAAVPTNWKRAQNLPAFSGPYRLPELDRYVYDLTIKGAWPLGQEPENSKDAPTVAGAAHSNGGGFIATTAAVASTAYVGPDARVLDNAQVLNNTRIEGKAVIMGNAIIRDDAIVSSNVQINGNVIVEHHATVRDNVYLSDNARVADDGKIQGDGYFYGGFTVNGKGVANGSHINTITNNATITGTAISNGHSWIDSGMTISTGGPYDGPSNYWSENDQGLFMHYDFTAAHPYRIKDIHVDNDAYYLKLDSQPGTSIPLVTDTTLNSSVLNLTGEGFVLLPRWILDQSNYSLNLKLNWQPMSLTNQTILEAQTSRTEKLSIILIPGSANQFSLELQFTSRDDITQSVTLINNSLTANQWLDLSLQYNNTTKLLKLLVTRTGESTPAEVSLTLPYATRELDYDSLIIHLGSSVDSQQALHALIDDVQLIR